MRGDVHIAIDDVRADFSRSKQSGKVAFMHRLRKFAILQRPLQRVWMAHKENSCWVEAN
jgi:hypothetical protein